MHLRARVKNAHFGDRRWIAGAIIFSCAAVPMLACTDGTTPDCSSPEAGCSPDLSGMVTEAGEASDSNRSYDESSVPIDTGIVPVIDAGDASLDAADAHG
jgi:hypothetical protein